MSASHRGRGRAAAQQAMAPLCSRGGNNPKGKWGRESVARWHVECCHTGHTQQSVSWLGFHLHQHCNSLPRSTLTPHHHLPHTCFWPPAGSGTARVVMAARAQGQSITQTGGTRGRLARHSEVSVGAVSGQHSSLIGAVPAPCPRTEVLVSTCV